MAVQLVRRRPARVELPSAAEGAQATAATLENGRYTQIVADLRDGAGLCDARIADEIAAWSGGGYAGLCP